MGVNIKNTSGPTIEKAGDLAGLLTTLERGDVLFIDEIHRLQPAIEEYLYPAMEDYKLDIIIDQGPNARSVRLNLPKFTLIGATTRAGMSQRAAALALRDELPARLLHRRGTAKDRPAQRRAASAWRSTTPGALEIAARSRGTPRIANNLLRWVRDLRASARRAKSRPRRRRPGADHARHRSRRLRRNGQAHPRSAHPQIQRRPGRARARSPSRSAKTPARWRMCTSPT